MKIAVIGGTGVYDSSFIHDSKKISVETPYGNIPMIKGNRAENEVFFLERHAANHKLTPSKVNYKGNIYALKSLGVDYIIGTAAVGGIQNCSVGDFVILDQFIDFTKNRSCTFFEDENSGVVHVDMTNPYCATVRSMLIESFKASSANIISSGTYVCTEGPRFETPAEIKMYKLLGADVVGMTNVPEVILARESALCYAAVALVTNYAAGISTSMLTHSEVSENMKLMSDKLKQSLEYLIDHPALKRHCHCNEALAEINTLK